MKYQNIPIDDISLDLENPRIRHYIEMYGENLTSEQIALALSDDGGSSSSAYTALREAIHGNKGIINPIIVNRLANGAMVVIEGNTRLQLYREFRKADPNGPWDKIIALVYDDIKRDEIHAIRLQTHLVGPREWDPFSKAKYLHHLYYEENLPMTTIVSYCGGKEREVRNFIQTYADMMSYYKPAAEAEGDMFSPRNFSKFAELQNVKKALIKNGFTESDFSRWVIHSNIDTAQNVRKLPEILSNEQAKKVFLKSNITDAYKLVNIPVKSEKMLSEATINELVEVLLEKMRKISYKEVRELGCDPARYSEVNNLDSLKTEVDDLINTIQDLKN